VIHCDCQVLTRTARSRCNGGQGHDLVAFQFLVPVEADGVAALLGRGRRATTMDDGIVKLTDFATIFDNFLCEAALFSVANDAQTQPATKEYCGKSLQLWLT
jgi:hypothetical protein